MMIISAKNVPYLDVYPVLTLLTVIVATSKTNTSYPQKILLVNYVVWKAVLTVVVCINAMNVTKMKIIFSRTIIPVKSVMFSIVKSVLVFILV